MMQGAALAGMTFQGACFLVTDSSGVFGFKSPQSSFALFLVWGFFFSLSQNTLGS